MPRLCYAIVTPARGFDQEHLKIRFGLSLVLIDDVVVLLGSVLLEVDGCKERDIARRCDGLAAARCVLVELVVTLLAALVASVVVPKLALLLYSSCVLNLAFSVAVRLLLLLGRLIARGSLTRLRGRSGGGIGGPT